MARAKKTKTAVATNPDFPDSIQVAKRAGVSIVTVSRALNNSKLVSAMANTLWKREPLELRKRWKDLLSGGDPTRRPIWEFTIEIYRAVLYLRLLNNEYLHAAAPRRLPAIQFDSVYGLPACNYATLTKPHKRQLRDRIAQRRAELKRQAEAKRATRQAPAQPPILIPLNHANPSAALQLWQVLAFRVSIIPQSYLDTRVALLHFSINQRSSTPGKALTLTTNPYIPP